MSILLLLALTDLGASDAPNPKVKPTEPLRANSYPSADAAVSARIHFGVLATPKRMLTLPYPQGSKRPQGSL
jgi:hypothetical protein